MAPLQCATKNPILPFFGTLAPHVAPQRSLNGVNHISMYFRHHSIEVYAKDILNLDFRFWADGCPLAEPCVKSRNKEARQKVHISRPLLQNVFSELKVDLQNFGSCLLFGICITRITVFLFSLLSNQRVRMILKNWFS